jgi:hypothetical protein
MKVRSTSGTTYELTNAAPVVTSRASLIPRRNPSSPAIGDDD